MIILDGLDQDNNFLLPRGAVEVGAGGVEDVRGAEPADVPPVLAVGCEDEVSEAVREDLDGAEIGAHVEGMVVLNMNVQQNLRSVTQHFLLLLRKIVECKERVHEPA